MAYAKVNRGFKELYFATFEPGTLREGIVKREIDKILRKHKNAVASVSEPCFDELKDVAVIGGKPVVKTYREPKGTELLGARQLEMLQTCVQFGFLPVKGGNVRKAADGLIRRGFLREESGKWFVTDAWLARQESA